MKPTYFHFKDSDRSTARIVEMPTRERYATIVSHHTNVLYGMLKNRGTFGEQSDAMQTLVKADLAQFLEGAQLFNAVGSAHVKVHSDPSVLEKFVSGTSVRTFVVLSPQVALDQVYSNVSQWQQHMVNHTYDSGKALVKEYAQRGTFIDDVALALEVKSLPKIKIRSHVEKDLREGKRHSAYVLCQEYIPGEYAPETSPVEMHGSPIYEFHAHCTPILTR